MERGLIDAFGRMHGAGFAAGLRANIFGVDLGTLWPELAGSAPRDWLPAVWPLRPADDVAGGARAPACMSRVAWRELGGT